MGLSMWCLGKKCEGRNKSGKKRLLPLDFDTQKFNQSLSVRFLGSSGTLIEGSKLKTLVTKTPVSETTS